MALVRREDWPSRLARAIALARARPFEWGVNDCCLFAADAIRAMTDTDLAEPWRGRYDSLLGARRALVALGAERLEDLAAALLGGRVPPALARRGDVMGFGTPEGLALGICVGARTAFVSEAGLGFVPTLSCVCGWRVG